MPDDRDEKTPQKKSCTDNEAATNSIVSRRTYLGLTGAAAATATGLSAVGTAAAVERHGIQFDTEIDVVDDLGCDPTGSEDCRDAILSAVDSNTLLRFPEGDYLIDGDLAIVGESNFGMYGEGDVSFVIPAGNQTFTPNYSGVSDGLFEGIDIDQTADDAVGKTRFGSDSYILVKDVEIKGAVEPLGRDATGHRMLPFASSGAEVEVRNFVAKDGGVPGSYRDGGGGIYVGHSNSGTVRLIDCHIEGFPNNGVYGGYSRGPLQIEGGVYKNNEVSQLRLTGPDTYVDGARIVIDKNDWGDGKLGDKEDHLNMRGVWWWSGDIDKTGGEIRNCEIEFLSSNISQGGIQIDETGGLCTIRDTRIRCDIDGLGAINSYPPEGDEYYDAPPSPTDVAVENVSITGSATGGSAVVINDRPNSSVRNCCIHQDGADRDGVTVYGSSNTTIADSTIDVTGDAINASGSNVTTSNISQSGTCPAPGDDGSGSDGSTDDGTDDGSDSGNEDGGSDDDPDPITLDNVLRVESDGGGVATYEVTVSDAIEGRDTFEDTIEGTTASGSVGPNRGIDGYDYAGEITDLTVDGPATVYRNGSEIDPDSSGEPTAPDLPNELVFDGNDPDAATTYVVEVTGEIAGDPTVGALEEGDEVTSGAISGLVTDDVDAFRFSGNVVSFEVDGTASVTFTDADG